MQSVFGLKCRVLLRAEKCAGGAASVLATLSGCVSRTSTAHFSGMIARPAESQTQGVACSKPA
jgi:hypothetical protein